MSREVRNSDDVIDSRDVIERISDLESEIEAEEERIQGEIDDLQIELDDLVEGDDDFDAESERLENEIQELENEKETCLEEERAELEALQALAEEAAQYADDWEHGVALIREDYFKGYAQQFADDIGAIDRNATWPLNCIDWDQAADELKQDYTEVDFDGVAYFVR